MPLLGEFSHSVAQIVQRTIIELGRGALPPSNNWPVSFGVESDNPDSVITVFNTSGIDSGSTQTDGELLQQYGFIVRVRSVTETLAWVRAEAIGLSFDQSLYQKRITIDSVSYLVHEISRKPVFSLGKETPQSKRNICVFNGLATITLAD